MVKLEWSFEDCKEEALKYERKVDFLKSSGKSYRLAFKRGWLDEICSHMKGHRKINGYWTKENCEIEAKKYKNKKEFHKNSASAYIIATRNSWIEDICTHMTSLINSQKRHIYKVSFDDGCIYIGLTYNPKIRFDRHLKEGTVYKYTQATNTLPVFELMSCTSYPQEDACELESMIIQHYQEIGKCVINKNKAGGLGGNKKEWVFDKTKLESLKYQTKKQFREEGLAAYNACVRNGWIELLCSHMSNIKNPNNYWSKERCQEEALKYNNRTQFKKESSSAYGAAYKNKWLDEICQHMLKKDKIRYYWTYENCKIESKKHINLNSFKINSLGAYGACYKNGWLKEFFPSIMVLKLARKKN